ncbi:MAG TPA: lasso peptide biosynthesis B2 protein [Coleofasciculaceae cyanobacterium]|jgi:hypothetical protein
MKPLRKFLHLKASDRHLLIVTFTLLGAIRLGLWLLPFRTWRHLLSRLMQAQSKLHKSDPASVSQVVWAVCVVSHYMPGGVKCLARAAATQVLLSRHGHAADLHIGVAKGEEGQLEAHAWVESQGQIVIGNLSNLSRFTPLSTFGGNRR